MPHRKITAMTPPTIPTLGVLISGRGSNMQALMDAISAGRLRAVVGIVISNRSDAPGLAIAEAAGVETAVLPHRAFANRDEYDQALVQLLKARRVDLVCLAGFMRRLGAAFCDAFPEAVLNVHPSLLPSFPGENAQRQAIAHGVKVSGATVHFVTQELDAGPIVAQRAVEVGEDETEETLSARILAVEHQIFPAAVARVLAGGWQIDGRRVVFPPSS
jgi:phosphoribosylglycinamide formyltransferase-1